MGSRLEREQVVGSKDACPLRDFASSDGNWPDEVLRGRRDTLMKLVPTAMVVIVTVEIFKWMWRKNSVNS